MTARTPRESGVTLAELLTVLVVLTVLAAVAVPLWRVHLLRVRREDGIAALIALQAAQDRYFGKNARYATLEQLGLKTQSERGYYDLGLRVSAHGVLSSRRRTSSAPRVPAGPTRRTAWGGRTPRCRAPT